MEIRILPSLLVFWKSTGKLPNALIFLCFDASLLHRPKAADALFGNRPDGTAYPVQD
jgi:hypothetical protein